MATMNVPPGYPKLVSVTLFITVYASFYCCAHSFGYQGSLDHLPWKKTQRNNHIQPSVRDMNTVTSSYLLSQPSPNLDKSSVSFKHQSYYYYSDSAINKEGAPNPLRQTRIKRKATSRNIIQISKPGSVANINLSTQPLLNSNNVPMSQVTERDINGGSKDNDKNQSLFPSQKEHISDSIVKESDANTKHAQQHRSDDLACEKYQQQCKKKKENPSPCHVEQGHNETVVRCSGLSLTTINPAWFPKNTTQLLLDHNNLETVLNFSFCHLSELRHLTLYHNAITSLHIKAFSGLRNLISLDLEYNSLLLDRFSYPAGIFAPLQNLRELRIGNGSSSNIIQEYPHKFLNDLQNLTTLSIDTVGETLYFGEDFLSLEKLTQLQITGDARKITDNSFENVKHLIYLGLDHLENLDDFSSMALKPLVRLRSFSLITTFIGVTKALNILQPLAERNATMTSIYFRQVFLDYHQGSLDLAHGGSVLDSNQTKYLRKICVKSFALVSSNLLVIKLDAFKDRWIQCLQSVDFSNNRIIGDTKAYGHIFHVLRNLRVFTCSGGSWDQHDHRYPYQLQPTEPKLPNYDDSASLSEPVTSGDGHSNVNKALSALSDSKKEPESSGTNKCADRYTNLEEICHTLSSTPVYQVFGPPLLKVFRFRNTDMTAPVNLDICFMNGQNIEYLEISNSYLRTFTNNIIGLTSLKTLVFSGNDMSVLSESFFDSFCKLEELLISDCFLDQPFVATKSARLFSSLLNIKRVDLSYNKLSLLSPGTFAANKKLEELNLAANGFNKIPFDLKNTPNLRGLDLRKNSVATLDKSVTIQLDELTKQPGGFYLNLAENILSCECSTLSFLAWLQTTNVVLDMRRNFTCMTDKGHLSFTGAFSDIKGLWRKCWGKFFLSLAVTLFMLMVLGFLIFFFVWKHKTLLKSWTLRALGGYRLKTPKDYKLGVFIGYSDSEYRFVCHTLREFIEENLMLPCYVRHRDLLPASDMGNCITEAINNSWRTVLVVSEDLRSSDDWGMFTIKCAIYAQGPDNPARLVVVVEEKVLEDVPPMLLHAVSEDNIIVVSDWEMTYEVKEKLRTRLTL